MRKLALFAFSLVGLFDSTYLWWAYTSSSHPLLCLGTGCDVVRASSYAHLWGLALPAYGAAMYAALALGIFAQALVSAPLERYLRLGVAAISGVGFLVSLALTAVEAFFLHAWCVWCVVSALAVTFILALALLDLARPASHLSLGGRPVWTYVAALVAALAVGAPAFLFLSRRAALPPMQPVSVEVLKERLVRPDSHAVGNLESPVSVVEFGDFQCPVCGQAQLVVNEIRRKYGDRVRFVFRQFPVAALHMHAETAAEASECAAEQSKFWEAEEKLYDRQNDLSEPALARYAAELGLDQNRFNRCLSSGSMAARVRRDLEDGRALGVRGTPTFFVGHVAIVGSPESAKLGQLIDHELSQQGVISAQSGPPTSPGLLANSGGIFSQFQNSGTACSEEEAAKQQPDLIRTPQARLLFESKPKALFVDVRAPKDFARERIPGALNIPAEEIEQRWSQLPRSQRIVLYESGRSAGDICASSRAAGRALLAHGFAREQVKVYQDGLAAWEKQALPTER